MSKVLCPAGCGKKFISEKFAAQHADVHHLDWRTPRSRGWCTPYGFGDFTDPITYEEACVRMKPLYDAMQVKFAPTPQPKE